MPPPEVSVVVAAYNEARWLPECLDSLANQTHPSYEVIVVDDGSSDATPSIAAVRPVRLLRQDHRGAGAARDAGARAAGGAVLVFLDADEIYAGDFLERLVAPLEDPQVTGTFPGGISWHNHRQGLAPGWLVVRGVRDGESVPRFGATHPFPKALRRVDFERAGGYPHVGHGEDEVFGRRVGPAVVVPEARFAFTLPTGAREVFLKARWIGRGPRFARERPPLRRLLPPASGSRAARMAAAGRGRAAVVRLLYDAGLLVGYADSRLRPARRHVA